MFKGLEKFWAAILVGSLTVAAIVALQNQQEPAQALRGSMFDPGLIISDSVFYDFGAMSATDIQRFLDGKVSSCRAGSTRPGCLKDYLLNTPAVTGSVGRCKSLPAKTNITAAQLISDVARACGINPRVILVKLEKEQGLVTATDPSPRSYEFALGMDCPDTPSGCSTTSAGFFWQLYRGVGQLNWYSNPAGPFTWLKPGTVISRPYHPNTFLPSTNANKCGQQSFTLRNKATAALYYYTPYVPNASALANLYSTGDRCSSYGNRNFWRLFSDWFGSPISGGFLLKASKGDTYLIVDEVKYRVPSGGLVASLKPLGPVGVVSRDYLDSFKTVGVMSPLIRSQASGQVSLLDNGKRIRFSNCKQVTTFGLNCDSAIALKSSQVSAFALAGEVTNVVAGKSGERYLVEAGQLREILNASSAAQAGVLVGEVAPIRLEALSFLKVGKPVASSGLIVSNRETGGLGIISDSVFYPIDKDTAKDVKFDSWFQGSGSSLSTSSIGALTPGPTIQSIVADSTGNQYLLTLAGKRLIRDSSSWIQSPTVIPDSVLGLIPTVSDQLVAPAVVRSTSSTALFLANDGQLRPIRKSDHEAVRASIEETTVHRISQTTLNQMRKGPQVIPPGSLIRVGTTNFLVDGLDRLYRIPSSAQARALGLGAPMGVKASAVSSFETAGNLSGIKVWCNSKPYLVVAGKLVGVSEANLSHYPTGNRTLEAGTCTTLEISSVSASRFIITPDKKYFLVENGKKRPIASTTQYLALKGSGAKAFSVDTRFASRIPTGSKVEGSAAEVESNIAVPTPAPSTSATSSRTYRVIAGDTLSRIAYKFRTKTAILVSLNNLTNANLIRVGQVLKLP
jgi:LysM repeat protein